MNHKRQTSEKPKDLKKSLTNFLFYLKPYFIPLIIALILASVGSICSIIGPDKVKEITNTIIAGLNTGIDLDKVKSIAIFLLTIYLLSAIFTYIEHFIMATITNRFSKRYVVKLVIKLINYPLNILINMPMVMFYPVLLMMLIL